MYNTIQELVNAINNGTTYKAKEITTYKEGILRNAIQISGEGTWLSPVIYDPDFMFSYSLNQIVDFINDCYKKSGVDREEITKLFDNKDLFLDRVYPEVANKDRNLGQIEERNLIHTDHLDLCEMYHIYLGEGMRIKISQQHLDRLGISKSELVEAARANNYGDFKMKSMCEMLSELMGMEFPQDDILYVITTNKNLYGASYIADYDILDYVATKLNVDKFIILPSSRHELIVTVHEPDEGNDLYDIVSSVNSTEVSEEDFLSNNVYLYDSTDRSLKYLRY